MRQAAQKKCGSPFSHGITGAVRKLCVPCKHAPMASLTVSSCLFSLKHLDPFSMPPGPRGFQPGVPTSDVGDIRIELTLFGSRCARTCERGRPSCKHQPLVKACNPRVKDMALALRNNRPVALREYAVEQTKDGVAWLRDYITAIKSGRFHPFTALERKAREATRNEAW